MLDDGRAAIVGLGATGSRMLERLADGPALTVIDRDVLAAKNLEDAPLYDEERVGEPKAVAAAAQVDAEVDAHVADLNARTADRLLADADVVLDGTDTVASRRLINEYALAHGTPWIHAAALGETGAVLPVVPGETACYDCVHGHADGTQLDTCETAGIDPDAADWTAATAVELARRVLEGTAEPGLRRYNGGETVTLGTAPRDDCAACAGERPHLDGKRGARATSICGAGTYQVDPHLSHDIEPDDMAEKLPDDGKVEVNDHLLRFDGEERFTLFRDGRMIVDAGSRERAKAIHARYVGH